MQKFIGVKEIEAQPMTLGEYNAFKGWNMPADEDPNKEGYMVKYSNDYISWSPKEPFEESYRITVGLPFGLAIEAAKKGRKIARVGWNGIGMFIYLVPGSTFKVDRKPLLGIYPEGTEINYRPHLDLKTADGSVATWAPSNSDALSEDWVILE